MAQSPLDGMYLFTSIPLGLAGLLLDLIGRNQNDPNTPQIPTNTANRNWISQPRPTSDPTVEVIQVNFKVPLSVSEVAWEQLRLSSRTEIWYRDRQNNWRQVMDESRIPVALDLATSSARSWYKAHFYCYPFVAKALQFRINRTNDPNMGNQPYPVGMKNALIRRNVYTRSDGTQGIEPQQDILGNVSTNYIKDWDAAKSFDDDPFTFWRSAPVPDPNGVVSLYLDCRNPSGGSQLIDTVYMDPVYTGQSVNLYYTNDDTAGTLKLSPIAAVPTADENTQWQQGKGRWDISADPGSSNFQFPMKWGPLNSQDAWVGIEWAPDFAGDDGPAQNPILFEVTPNTPGGGQYWPKISYDVGAGTIVLTLTNGTLTQTYTAALSPILVQYQPLRIVVGWTYGTTKKVFISVKTPNGAEVANYFATASSLPPLITLDGSIGFEDFRGLFTAHVIKLENYAVGQASFQSNPGIYVSPDPVLPDPSGNIPATSLDNAIFAAAWAMQEQGTGGDHESRYENKTWTPVWRNYFSQKGKLYLPQQISMKYLKLEFTHLCPEPYPVYDSGVQTSYKIFPASVTQSVTTKHPGLLGVALGLLTVGADVILGSIGSVNWLNPSTINNAVNSVFGQTVSPVDVQVGAGQIVTSLPNTTSLDVAAQTRREIASPYVYKRSPTNAFTLAGHQIGTVQDGNANQGLTPSVNTVVGAITDSFTPLENFAANPTGSLPQQGNDWWIFPGATLSLPAVLMNGLTAVAQTIFGRPDTTVRNRFDTTSVHRYDVRTVTRDAALAYFAGVREVQPMVTSHIASLDPPRFDFSRYDGSQWVLTNTTALDSGPITTAGHTYQLINPNFDLDINNWTQAQGTWVWDNVQGHYFLGTARTTATGAIKELRSTRMDVAPGAHIDGSVWVKYSGVTATASSQAIQLLLRYYDVNDNLISTTTAGITNGSWPSSHDWAQITIGPSTAPAGSVGMRLCLVVAAAASAGQFWFDTPLIGTTDSVEGTAFKDFITTSTFAKVKCSFTDSGVVRSDDMWARNDLADLNIDMTALAYYTSTIPDVIPSGMWGDTFAEWADDTIAWGAPRAVVAINVDPDRIYDGKRVLHFSRAGGAEEAGVKVRQHTNFVANGLFRIGAVFLKPYPNDNQVTLRLRRVSDGVYIHEESITPPSGYWYEYLTDFIEIPDTDDQEYTVELVLTGDDPDEFYLNDLYSEVSHIRYFCRLGDGSAFLHDVTQLRYADSAIVSATLPVNEFSIQVAILSSKAWAYGVQATPIYLK